MCVYLDNDVVCGLVALDFGQTENDALKIIRQHVDSGDLGLVTSPLTDREIARYLGPKKPGRPSKQSLEAVAARIPKVPFQEDHTVHGFHDDYSPWGGGSYPLVSDDPISSELRSMGLNPDRTDCHHLMIAIRNGCKVFVTVDRRVRHRRDLIANRFKIQVMKPSEFVTRQSAKAGPLHRGP